MSLTDAHTRSDAETRVGLIMDVIGEEFYNHLWDDRGFAEESLVTAGSYSRLWNEIFLAAMEVLDE